MRLVRRDKLLQQRGMLGTPECWIQQRCVDPVRIEVWVNLPSQSLVLHSTWKLKWLEKDSPFRISFHVKLRECTIFRPWILIHKVILPSLEVFGESWSSTLGDLDGILHGSGAWSFFLWKNVDGGFHWRPATSSTSHGGWNCGRSVQTHRIQVWYIYLHLPSKSTKCW